MRTLAAGSAPWVECAERDAWAGHTAVRQVEAGPPHRTQIGLLGLLGQAAQLHVLEHPLA
jgi:hypothetical protein